MLVLVILTVMELNTFQKKKKVIRNKYIKPNIFRIQAYHSIICSYFSIGFIDFMLTGKRLTGFTNLFPSNKLKK